ncbi:MAG TPA: hypothetical protein VGF55_28675 [Gemmataceae bacterium]|jgi:hypothetical protein
MLHNAVSALLRRVGGRPCFRIHGRASYEPDWHVIDVFAEPRRNLASRWPACAGTCITWTANVIAVGWDFAEEVLREQTREPPSRDRPVVVCGGRLRHSRPGACGPPSASEVLAHECGHTGQARRMGVWYWPTGAALTLFREGGRWWNRFENEASATGHFGGIVNGSVCPELLPGVAG